jgi:ketosteroid isomerase-like protein
MVEGAQLVRDAYAALNARDADTVMALCRPDFVLATTVETHHGHQGARDWIERVDETFDDYTAEVLAVDQVRGRLVVSVHQRGRGRGSGIDVDQVNTHVWTLRGGLAAELRAFTERDEALRWAEAAEPPDV